MFVNALFWDRVSLNPLARARDCWSKALKVEFEWLDDVSIKQNQ